MKLSPRVIVVCLVLTGLCAAGFRLAFYRGPRMEEIVQHYLKPPLTAVRVVDISQSDIGTFGLEVTDDAGTRAFWIETSKQWVWPSQTYDWGQDR